MFGSMALSLVLLAMGPRQSTAAGTASVQGVVMDGDHKPLPGATAYAIADSDVKKEIYSTAIRHPSSSRLRVSPVFLPSREIPG
jgi:hypothetical protein